MRQLVASWISLIVGSAVIFYPPGSWLFGLPWPRSASLVCCLTGVAFDGITLYLMLRRKKIGRGPSGFPLFGLWFYTWGALLAEGSIGIRVAVWAILALLHLAVQIGIPLFLYFRRGPDPNQTLPSTDQPAPKGEGGVRGSSA